MGIMRKASKPNVIVSKEVQAFGGYTDPITGATRGNKGGGAPLKPETFHDRYPRRKLYGPALFSLACLRLNKNLNDAASTRTKELRNVLVDHPNERKSFSPLSHTVNRGKTRSGVHERGVQAIKDAPIVLAIGAVLVSGANYELNNTADSTPRPASHVTVQHPEHQNNSNSISPGIKIRGLDEVLPVFVSPAV